MYMAPKLKCILCKRERNAKMVITSNHVASPLGTPGINIVETRTLRRWA
jgi:hypothetical protein